MHLLYFYNEYISLQMKEIYKMSIWKVWEQEFWSWFKELKQRQRGVSLDDEEFERNRDEQILLRYHRL